MHDGFLAKNTTLLERAGEGIKGSASGRGKYQYESRLDPGAGQEYRFAASSTTAATTSLAIFPRKDTVALRPAAVSHSLTTLRCTTLSTCIPPSLRPSPLRRVAGNL
eukprot:9348775-Pyramimonas_sp.AAC.1